MALLDFDNDGLLDLYEANGRVGLQSERFSNDPYAEPNLLLRGVPRRRGSKRCTLGAARRRRSSPPAAPPRSATSTTTAGSTSLVANRDARAHLLRNVVAAAAATGSTFRVLDEHGRDALGAELTMTVGSRAVRRDVRAAYSYLASNDPRVHVGLGSDDARGIGRGALG